jgi:hypothetical protein
MAGIIHYTLVLQNQCLFVPNQDKQDISLKEGGNEKILYYHNAYRFYAPPRYNSQSKTRDYLQMRREQTKSNSTKMPRFQGGARGMGRRLAATKQFFYH